MKVRYLEIILILFSFGILLLNLVSCGNKDKSKPTYYLSTEFKSYFKYTAGSYWIYADASNNVVDSVYIIRGNSSIIAGGSKFDYNFESIIGEIGSLKHSPQQFQALVSVETFNHLLVNNEEIYFENFVKGSENRGTNLLMETLQSYTIGNLVYKNVKVFTSIEPITFTKVYWAPEVGVIRKENKNGEIFLLKRFLIK